MVAFVGFLELLIYSGSKLYLKKYLRTLQTHIYKIIVKIITKIFAVIKFLCTFVRSEGNNDKESTLGKTLN